MSSPTWVEGASGSLLETGGPGGGWDAGVCLGGGFAELGGPKSWGGLDRSRETCWPTCVSLAKKMFMLC